MKNISEKFKCAILARYPNAQNLRTPDTPGSQNNVIFADVNNKTYVFKFGNINQIKKNIEVSKLYKLRKIPCPEIKLGEYDGLFFEEYEMLPGITLHEAVKNGLPADKIKQIYCEIIDNIVKMGRIPGAHLVNTKNIYVHQCAKEHITNVNGSVLGYICMAAVYTMNIGDKKAANLYHSDITPKNTIVSDSGHLVGFIDLDSVAISNVNYVFGMMAAKYIEMGFDIEDLFIQYEKISDKKLNHAHVSKIANSMVYVKKTLWKLSQQRNK